jgi:secretion/DNA translocation related TadE-like protein
MIICRVGRPGKPTRTTDAGSATVWLLSALFTLGFLAAIAFTLVTIGAARQRAAAAADLAALAAAGMPPSDEATVCARASRLSLVNGARLVECHVTAESVDVAVRVTASLPGAAGVGAEVGAHARAGPWGRAAGAYLPPAAAPTTGQERASAGRAAAAASPSPPWPSRRRRSATLATIRSPRRGWEFGLVDALPAGPPPGVGRAGVGIRTAERTGASSRPVAVVRPAPASRAVTEGAAAATAGGSVAPLGSAAAVRPRALRTAVCRSCGSGDPARGTDPGVGAAA